MEARNGSGKGKKKSMLSSPFVRCYLGKMCNPAKIKGGSKREVKVSLFYLSGVDRILAAWVMAPPIFFYRNYGGGRRGDDESSNICLLIPNRGWEWAKGIGEERIGRREMRGLSLCS